MDLFEQTCSLGFSRSCFLVVVVIPAHHQFAAPLFESVDKGSFTNTRVYWNLRQFIDNVRSHGISSHAHHYRISVGLRANRSPPSKKSGLI